MGVQTYDIVTFKAGTIRDKYLECESNITSAVFTSYNCTLKCTFSQLNSKFTSYSRWGHLANHCEERLGWQRTVSWRHHYATWRFRNTPRMESQGVRRHMVRF